MHTVDYKKGKLRTKKGIERSNKGEMRTLGEIFGSSGSNRNERENRKGISQKNKKLIETKLYIRNTCAVSLDTLKRS